MAPYVTRNGKTRKMQKDVTFMQLRAANASRVAEWHGINDWNIMEWACAMAGEAGEFCNVAKKIKRRQTNIEKDKKNKRLDLDQQLGDEAADIVIYLDLACQRQGINLAAHVRSKFNATSRKFKFPQRL